MRVFVTGASGFVGQGVVRALLRHGHEVLGLVRDRLRCPRDLLGQIRLVEGQMQNPPSYRPVVREVDAVIHCAQQTTTGRWTARRVAEMHRLDEQMTGHLARACARQGKRLIYTSGSLTHAGYDGAWIDESRPQRPCRLAEGHAARELELKAWARQGLDAVILSPGFVYGPGGMLGMTIELLRRGRYRIIDSGENYWSLVHVDDVGEAFALALLQGRPGETYFLADERPLRRRQLVERLTARLGLAPVGHVPGWLAGLVLGRPLVEATNASQRLRCGLARQRLGWRPRYACLDEYLPELLPEPRTNAPAPGQALVDPHAVTERAMAVCCTGR